MQISDLRRYVTWEPIKLFGEGSAQRLAAVRIGLCTMIALRLALRPDLYLPIADKPDDLFQPRSFTRLLDTWPSQGVITTLWIVGIVAAVAAAAGLRGRIALPVMVACELILNGLLNSQGKIEHNEVLISLCLLCLVPARHSDVWSVDWLLARRRARAEGRPEPPSERRGYAYGWPVAMAMVVIAGAYFFVGWHKIGYSGMDWWRGGNLRWVLYAASDHQHGNTVGLFIADHRHITQLFAAGTLLIECFFFVCLFVPITRWFFVPGAISLHLGIQLTMHLNYTPQWWAVMVVFVNWPVAIAWLRARRAARAGPQATPTTA
jgi:hypothetical protein